VFQAERPDGAPIQTAVDANRHALGDINNGNATGPLTSGRRDTDRDGDGSTATAVVVIDEFIYGKAQLLQQAGRQFRRGVDGATRT
jgi:hypothetical protein